MSDHIFANFSTGAFLWILGLSLSISGLRDITLRPILVFGIILGLVGSMFLIIGSWEFQRMVKSEKK